jgi:hypothetical protein
VAEFYVEFDRQQIVVETDVQELTPFLRTVYAHMLVPHALSPAGRLTIVGTEDGFQVDGTVTLRVKGKSVSDLFLYIKKEVHFLFMRARPDLMWLHAGAVEQNGSALLLCGASGQGKSTLTVSLCDAGSKFLSDDVAPIGLSSDSVYPFAQSPSRRIDPGVIVSDNAVAALERADVYLDSDQICRHPVPLRCLIYLTYDRGTTARLERMKAGEGAFAMLSNATNVVDLKEAAVARASQLARTIPAYRLCYADPSGVVKILAGL